MGITSNDVMLLSGDVATPQALAERIEKIEKMLSDRIDKIEKRRLDRSRVIWIVITTTVGVIITATVGAVITANVEMIRKLLGF